MKYVQEPTYKKYITGKLERFDERNTGFSRGATSGDKYTAMHDKSVANIEKQVTGKTILEHAMWVSGRTVDYILRKNRMARETAPIYNSQYRLENPDPVEMTAESFCCCAISEIYLGLPCCLAPPPRLFFQHCLSLSGGIFWLPTCGPSVLLERREMAAVEVVIS